jgi:hypothetical protein
LISKSDVLFIETSLGVFSAKDKSSQRLSIEVSLCKRCYHDRFASRAIAYMNFLGWLPGLFSQEGEKSVLNVATMNIESDGKSNYHLTRGEFG